MALYALHFLVLLLYDSSFLQHNLRWKQINATGNKWVSEIPNIKTTCLLHYLFPYIQYVFILDCDNLCLKRQVLAYTIRYLWINYFKDTIFQSRIFYAIDAVYRRSFYCGYQD
jgi:hypothetical protein